MNPVRILLVDDNPVFLRSISDLLSEYDDLQVVGTAQYGIDALDRVRDLHPDLVILDYLMLGMSGLDTMRLIKAAFNPPKVILVTLYPEKEFGRVALESGADAFVQKVDIPGRLLEEIHRLFPGTG